jgi:hypothetical protein
LKQFLAGMVFALALVAGAAAWIWYQQPELLPAGLQVQNPNSPKFAPAVYRWKDAQGRTQVSDEPPAGRPYETVRVDINTNVVPDTLPTERDVAPHE